MPLPRFDKLDPERQESILAAARAEFSTRGFSAASHNTIIKQAGLSKGAMYYYFSDKADLCRTVLERVLDRLAEAAGPLGRFESAAGFWIEVHALAERAMGFALGTPELADLCRLIYGEGANSELLEPLVERAQAWCSGLLREGQRVGAVRHDIPLELLATAVTGMLVHTDRWITRRLETLDPAELERLSFLCLEMVERLVAPSPSDSPPSTP
jgi:AcrR family transcriptional regulator